MLLQSWFVVSFKLWISVQPPPVFIGFLSLPCLKILRMFWGYLGHVIVEGPRKQKSVRANLAWQSFPTQMRRSVPKQVWSNFIFYQRGRVHIVGASVSSITKNIKVKGGCLLFQWVLSSTCICSFAARKHAGSFPCFASSFLCFPFMSVHHRNL